MFNFFNLLIARRSRKLRQMTRWAMDHLCVPSQSLLIFQMVYLYASGQESSFRFHTTYGACVLMLLLKCIVLEFELPYNTQSIFASSLACGIPLHEGLEAVNKTPPWKYRCKQQLITLPCGRYSLYVLWRRVYQCYHSFIILSVIRHHCSTKKSINSHSVYGRGKGLSQASYQIVPQMLDFFQIGWLRRPWRTDNIGVTQLTPMGETTRALWTGA